MGHGLDDVVQWFMFPVGDPGTGGIQSHVKWLGAEHACHLRIGKAPIGSRRVAPARGRRILQGIAQVRFAHGGGSR
jgi:hypothetical protein